MKKILLSIIIINLMFVPIFQSALTTNAIVINEGTDIVTNGKYTEYINCTISTKQGYVEGEAFLFPGFFSSWPGSDSTGIDVKIAFGVLILNTQPCPDYGIYFNNVRYYSNWTKAYVFLLTGYFYNYFYAPLRVFEIHGTAKFVRVYHS